MEIGSYEAISWSSTFMICFNTEENSDEFALEVNYLFLKSMSY